MRQRESKRCSNELQPVGVSCSRALRSCAEKSLLIFPFVSGLACLAVMASFAIPLWMTGAAERLGEHGKPDIGIWGYALLFAFYFANYFVIVFFNAARSRAP